MSLIVSPQNVRDYLLLTDPGVNGSNSRYSDSVITAHILSAQDFLEHETHRFLSDHTAQTWSATTLLRAQVAIPGFRSFTTATWGGVTLTVGIPGDGNTGPSAWAIPDDLNTGTYVALQFRPWRVDTQDWWLADHLWWDKSLDSPFFPGNWGGGYAWTSMPNDLIITGNAGYAAGSEPDALKQAVLMLAAFETKRPASILADVAITASGGVIKYAELPNEVERFIRAWRIGTQAASVG
jgi:hypothetical protein